MAKDELILSDPTGEAGTGNTGTISDTGGTGLIDIGDGDPHNPKDDLYTLEPVDPITLEPGDPTTAPTSTPTTVPTGYLTLEPEDPTVGPTDPTTGIADPVTQSPTQQPITDPPTTQQPTSTPTTPTNPPTGTPPASDPRQGSGTKMATWGDINDLVGASFTPVNKCPTKSQILSCGYDIQISGSYANKQLVRCEDLSYTPSPTWPTIEIPYSRIIFTTNVGPINLPSGTFIDAYDNWRGVNINLGSGNVHLNYGQGDRTPWPTGDPLILAYDSNVMLNFTITFDISQYYDHAQYIPYNVDHIILHAYENDPSYGDLINYVDTYRYEWAHIDGRFQLPIYCTYAEIGTLYIVVEFAG